MATLMGLLRMTRKLVLGAPTPRLPARLCAGAGSSVPGSGRAGPGMEVHAEKRHVGHISSGSRTLFTRVLKTEDCHPPLKAANTSEHWRTLFSPAAPSAGSGIRCPSPPAHWTACDLPQAEPFLRGTSRRPPSQHLAPAWRPRQEERQEAG